jgi:hypothetical protein
VAKARSPSYPIIGLREAIDRVTAIYRKDYQSPIPRSVAVEHMGYRGLSGKSLGVLAALTRYNLLEGRGDNTRVTDVAVQIIAHPAGVPERVEAIKAAATHPGLFADLEARFGGKGSDSAIRAYLLMEKFIPNAAGIALRAYRETKLLLEEEMGGQDKAKSPENRPLISESSDYSLSTSTISQNVTAVASTKGGTREIVNIRVARDCAIKLLADGPYTKRSIEALVKNLQLQLELGAYDDIEIPDTTQLSQS